MRRILYIIGSVSFGIICGTGHLLFELSGEKPVQSTEILSGLTVALPGKETDVLTLTTGISLVMGVMLIAFGTVNLLLAFGRFREHIPTRGLIILNLLFSGTVLLLIWKYLFIVPLLFTGIGFLCFLAAFFIPFSAKSSPNAGIDITE